MHRRLTPAAGAALLTAAVTITAGCTSASHPAAGPAPGSASGYSATVTVTSTSCAGNFTTAKAGDDTFDVDNQASEAGEINLDNSEGAIVGEIETIGPDTTAAMSATLPGGTYYFNCLMGDSAPYRSKTVTINAPRAANGSIEDIPVTLPELSPANFQYIRYASGQLAGLSQQVKRIQADLKQGNIPAAKSSWLAAQEDWERTGASYDSFGTLGTAVDGLPEGLPLGVNDPGFTGLHRLEYGLWHGQPAAVLEQVTAALAKNVSQVSANLESDDEAADASQLPVRCHEILEDALRDHLSGMDNEGAGAAYPMTLADLQVTSVVLGYLTPLLDPRDPGLVKTADGQMSTLAEALGAAKVNGEWAAPESTPLAAREYVDGAIGALLETLSAVPDLLEVPPSH